MSRRLEEGATRRGLDLYGQEDLTRIDQVTSENVRDMKRGNKNRNLYTRQMHT